MIVQTKYYLTKQGHTLDSNLEKASTGTDVAMYDSEVEIDAALAANGTVGILYTIESFKEVVEE